MTTIYLYLLFAKSGPSAPPPWTPIKPMPVTEQAHGRPPCGVTPQRCQAINLYGRQGAERHEPRGPRR